MPHEPKKRHSKARKRTRRAAISLAEVSFMVCKNCSKKTLAHMACRSCGYYKGQVLAGFKPKAVVTKT